MSIRPPVLVQEKCFQIGSALVVVAAKCCWGSAAFCKTANHGPSLVIGTFECKHLHYESSASCAK